jgi:tRNA uridine 5-carboxymethylaminomethyl modification enzyme
MNEIYKYEVVVIGGGFAGSQAAMSSARSGAKTLIISINMDNIAAMPFGNIIGSNKNKNILKRLEKYNSRIPGIIRDKSLIEIKKCGYVSKDIIGGKVVDKKRYSFKIKELLEKTKSLDTRQGLVTDIIKNADGYDIITSDHVKYSAVSVILCPGTFLNSEIFWGENKLEAGRIGEIRSLRLYKNLENKGLRFKRARVYTAPVIEKKTINSRRSGIIKVERKNTEYYISLTERDYFNRGNVQKNKNFILLPEGIDTGEMYVCGFENSFPEELQVKILRNSPGLEKAAMTRPGYGISYWVLRRSQVSRFLEFKKFKGMFFAGRINGTDTYEQSLVQGLFAGINACRRVKGLELEEL